MTQIKRIEKNLKELEENGAKFSLFKTRKYWMLMQKDNVLAPVQYEMGLNDIEHFVLDKCIELDSKTGIKQGELLP